MMMLLVVAIHFLALIKVYLVVLIQMMVQIVYMLHGNVMDGMTVHQV